MISVRILTGFDAKYRFTMEINLGEDKTPDWRI